MEIGVDSFAAVDITEGIPSSQDRVRAVADLIERIVYADEVGLDIFGIGEHQILHHLLYLLLYYLQLHYL